jgi:hypothetical protein
MTQDEEDKLQLFQEEIECIEIYNDWTMQIDIKWTQFRLFCENDKKITFYIDLQLITEFIY